jgi:hypothetical protein
MWLCFSGSHCSSLIDETGYQAVRLAMSDAAIEIPVRIDLNW